MKTTSKFILSFSIVGIAILSSCNKSRIYDSSVREPILPSQPYNYNAQSDEIATLGRVLFYEVQLSANNTVSCGTCHIQSLAFSDGKKFSVGLADRLTSRNTPGISAESANHGLFWDSRAMNFDDLVLMPVTNHTEMGILDANTLPEKLRELKYYNKLFTDAYGSSEITIEKIRNSMAAFLTSLNRPRSSKFEQGMSKQFVNLTELERIGKDVFNEKGKCNSCHTLSFGWRDAANIGLELDYTDQGIGALESTNVKESAEGVFRVPGLFNIELTAPYMHDGRFSTLEQVVEHYNSGVKPHRNLDWRLKNTVEGANGSFSVTDEPQSLHLTEAEKKGLVAFLKTLTDWEYVKDPKFNNPFIR
jgi:cytochrome c peroxidase